MQMPNISKTNYEVDGRKIVFTLMLFTRVALSITV